MIVAANFRRYRRFVTTLDQRYDEGICFFDNTTTRIANYPMQHSANCTTKHQATAEWFKPAVRILKNMRQRLVDNRVIAPGVAPSYFLEGLLYNVPSNLFGNSYQHTMHNALTWLIQNDQTRYVCANEQYFLLRDSNVTWAPAKYEEFKTTVINLWDGWQ